ncbi:MAG TPA: ribonuclease HII [Thermodesulfobacteriota bacterium]
MPGVRRVRGRLAFEREAYAAGWLRVAGVDEAGRGPLAGPVVAAAVVLPPGARLPGVTDSKQLDPATRERLFARVEARALAVGVGIVGPEEIDRINILRASLKAMSLALAALACPRTGAPLEPDYVLVDGIVPIPGVARQRTIPQGDARSLSIGAASIVAKVTRDRLMEALDREHPGYGFARHKGYPTPEHLEAIRRNGVLPVHRRTFRGVREHCPEWWRARRADEPVQAPLWERSE